MAESLADYLESLPPEQVSRIVATPIGWAEALLVTPTEEKPFRANYIQQLILGSTRRYNVIRCHRRGGKSFGLSVLALYYSVMYPSCQVLIAAPGAIQVQELFSTIREFLRANEWLAAEVSGDRQSPQRIEFTNGSRITGLTTGSRTRGGGKAFRGQGADVFLIDEGAYLNEADWDALTAIMRGDQYRRFKVRVFVASTPAMTRGRYFDLCTHDKYKDWNRIHVGILDNPDMTEEDRAEARVLSTDLGWTTEYLAEFPEIGAGVFPKSLVEASVRNYRYDTALQEARAFRGEPRHAPIRTMGVDWDKFQQDGSGPNISILEATPQGAYRLIYREEIPQTEYSLTKACGRVVKLHAEFHPRWIYLDRGYGEMQVEQLQLYAKKNPHSGLKEKLIGVHFAQKVQCQQPLGGVENKMFKEVMINLLRKWLEDGFLELPGKIGDEILMKQIEAYHVVGQTDAHIKYSDGFDHAIASLGLAAMAMFERVKNPFVATPATRCYWKPIPEPVDRAELQPIQQLLREQAQQSLLLKDPAVSGMRRPFSGESRSFLGGQRPFGRSTF